MPKRLFLACTAATALVAAAPAAATDEGERLANVCASCHGPGGASPGESIPIIGGQDPAYLADGLRGYRDGERESYIMAYFANPYSDAQIDSLAAWFAEQPWVSTETPFDADLAAEAAPVAEGLCNVCHGEGGLGTEIGPRIAGQPVFYLIDSMNAYRDGRRGASDEAMIMQQIIMDVPDDEIEALAHHYSGQR